MALWGGKKNRGVGTVEERGQQNKVSPFLCWLLFLECSLSSFTSYWGGEYLNTFYWNLNWERKTKYFLGNSRKIMSLHNPFFLVRGCRKKYFGVFQDVIDCILLYKLPMMIYSRYKFCPYNSILEEKMILIQIFA